MTAADHDRRAETPEHTGAVLGDLARNWWVVAVLVAVGVVAGALVTLVAPAEYTATASVYIGQTTDANGNPMAGLNSNARAAAQLLDSDAVLKEAAEATGDGMTAAALRRHTTVETPTQAVKGSTSVVNFVTIAVTDADPDRAAAAANAMADALLARIGDSNDEKIGLLERQRDELEAALTAAARRAQQAERALASIARAGGSAADRAAASAPYVAVAQAAASEQSTLLTSLQKTDLMLVTVDTVEVPRLLHEAAAPAAKSGPSMALNVAAGALAGLVIGILAALARARLRRPA